MGTASALTEKDCQVCHAEYDQAAGTTSALHANGLIDLRSGDNATSFYEYDPSTFLGSPATANSGNATWKKEMSGRTQPDDTVGTPNVACALPKAPPAGWTCTKGLDRFCLSCHDSDGASASYALGDTGATAKNPFFDNTAGAAVISNEYDQQNRATLATASGGTGGVVDIERRVAVTGRAYTAADRDASMAPANRSGAFARNDPPEGAFSRHAIRGLSQSVYVGTSPAWDGTTYFNTVNGNQWASSSVMNCADCHTNDGANTTTGNAHGATSEYMLKDATGLAGIGSSNTTVVCAQCHVGAKYVSGTHTNNGGDFSWTTGANGKLGSARWAEANVGNVYGWACGNCHGNGAPSKAGSTFPTGSSGYGGYGTIHGTSQVLGTGDAGATGSRNGYRFMTGGGMRYYIPGDWTTSAARNCVTLAGGAGDSWGGCTKHSGTGVGDSKLSTSGIRPLAY